MAKKVSGKTHTRQQLNDYANQHNPNNKAYQARVANERSMKKSSRTKEARRQADLFRDLGLDGSLGWMCYSNPYDLD